MFCFLCYSFICFYLFLFPYFPSLLPPFSLPPFAFPIRTSHPRSLSLSFSVSDANSSFSLPITFQSYRCNLIGASWEEGTHLLRLGGSQRPHHDSLFLCPTTLLSPPLVIFLKCTISTAHVLYCTQLYVHFHDRKPSTQLSSCTKYLLYPHTRHTCHQTFSPLALSIILVSCLSCLVVSTGCKLPGTRGTAMAVQAQCIMHVMCPCAS